MSTRPNFHQGAQYGAHGHITNTSSNPPPKTQNINQMYQQRDPA